jgi:heat shock protein HslJ
VSFTNPVEKFDVEKPESYLLTFNRDGTVSIKADCNNAGGSYTADTPSARVLALKIGPMTLAACPPGSRGEQFVKLLGGAARYFFKDGKLFINLMADGGTFAFAPGGKPAPAAATPGALTTQPWQWVSFTSPVEQVQIDKPENYVLTFNKDGAVEIKADCNRTGGTYTTTADGALTIKVGPTTMAACPPPSRGEQFVKLLGGAARYFFKDGKLFIDLMADGGTFMLAPA